MNNMRNEIYEITKEIHQKMYVLDRLKSLNDKEKYSSEFERLKIIYDTYNFYKYGYDGLNDISNKFCERLLHVEDEDIVTNGDGWLLRDGSCAGSFYSLQYLIREKIYLDATIKNYESILYDELNEDLDTINQIINLNQEKYDKYIARMEKEKNRKKKPQYGYVYIIKVDQYFINSFCG